MLKRPQLYAIIEAGLVGLFFVQAIRFLISMIYSRIAGASAVTALTQSGIPFDSTSPAPDPALVGSEVTFVIYMLALPLIALLFGRFRPLIFVSVILVALGRLFMSSGTVLTPLAASALVVGGTLVYVVMIARHRATVLPYLFILGFAGDQLFRAFGNTVDPSLSSDYTNIQIVLSALALLTALLTLILEREHASDSLEDRGLLPIWGAVGLSGLLYLQLTLLSLPNAIAGRADTNYTLIVVPLVVATLLPIVPFVRARAGAFIGMFDGGVRGWLWMLLVAILIVLGTRLSGVVAGGALIAAQFFLSLTWFWLTRPRAERERSFGGLWMLFGMALFAVLIIGDNFTYEYAFVRNLTGNAAFLNDIIPPLLRGFRGFGIGLLLLAVFLAVLPMTQMTKRVAWRGRASALQSLLLILVVAAAGVGAWTFSRPPVIAGVRGAEQVRVGTYNLHGGYDQFYNSNLDAVARTIIKSGADIVLLQEVDAGRVTSFGVDQSLWLARRLGMDRRFFPTNEGMQGLAVLSRVPFTVDSGVLLTSLGTQTGVQYVQVGTTPNDSINLYNVWLSPLFDIGAEELSAQQQDQEVQLNEFYAAYIQQECSGSLGRTLIGGTFHNVPDSPLVTGLRGAGFSDPFAGLPIELSATFTRTGLPRTRFDYLWTCNLPAVGAGVIDLGDIESQALPPISRIMPGQVINSSASDHRLAVADVVLVRQAGG